MVAGDDDDRDELAVAATVAPVAYAARSAHLNPIRCRQYCLRYAALRHFPRLCLDHAPSLSHDDDDDQDVRPGGDDGYGYCCYCCHDDVMYDDGDDWLIDRRHHSLGQSQS